MKGDIIRVDRLRMGTDGKGVSTLVSLFGCPLNCAYCINSHCHETRQGTERHVLVTPEELVREISRDGIYYMMSGGGIVFGGGEPLMQPEFIHEVCKLINPGWQVRIETSLNVPWQSIHLLLQDVDEWIIDIKDMNDVIYEKYTGAHNMVVKANLCELRRYVDSSRLHIRIPRIEGYNSEKDVDRSFEEVRGMLQVEPEVFDYIASC